MRYVVNVILYTINLCLISMKINCFAFTYWIQQVENKVAKTLILQSVVHCAFYACSDVNINVEVNQNLYPAY